TTSSAVPAFIEVVADIRLLRLEASHPPPPFAQAPTPPSGNKDVREPGLQQRASSGTSFAGVSAGARQAYN
ncbi:hypothetical protein FRC00_000478, partial [Tulasnella sp. 408]